MRKLVWMVLPLLATLAVLPVREDSRPNTEAAPAPFPRRTREPALSRAWPMMGGTPARNMANPHVRGIVDDFDVTTGRNVRWSVLLGCSYGYSLPAIAGSRLFIGTNNKWPRDPGVKGDRGVMLCVCAHNGERLWQITHEALKDTANHASQHGVVSSPSVDRDRVYYVSNRAEVVCADVSGDGKGNGKIIWSFDMVKRLGVFPCQHSVCSPLVFGDGVFVVTGNGGRSARGGWELPAPHAPAFLALHKRTGQVLWHSNLPGKRVMEGQWGNPAGAVVNGRAQVLFPGGDGWLDSFEPKTGELLWKFDCNPKHATSYMAGGHNEKGFSILTAPVIHEDKVYVAIGQNPDNGNGVGHLWCIDATKVPRNKEKDLSPINDNFDAKDPVNKDSGLVWHYGGPEPNPPKGQQIDAPEFRFGRTLGTVAIHEGLLYAVEFGGYLHCLDARTGQRHWVHDLEDPAWASAAYADGKVFVATQNGNLHIFRHGRAPSKPHLCTLPRHGLYSTPVAVGGVLYLNAGERLYALAKP